MKALQELKEKLQEAAGQNDVHAMYTQLQHFTMQQLEAAEEIHGDKKLYYISAEFLLGKMLTSNLLQLGMLEEVQKIVKELGVSWKQIQDEEAEPSLGNGGLGRLAACFLDSIASLNLCGDGVGLYYHFGLFEQKFKDHKQLELPNAWLDEDVSWFRSQKVPYTVEFEDFTLQPIRYDMEVIGKEGKKNYLHLFDVETVDEKLVKEGISFDKTDIPHNLTLFLYPDDSDENGRLLRIYQQYFMVSCAAQMILADCKEKGYDLHTLDEHIVIQINDTHPSLVIPELIRLLMKEGMALKEALRIVEKVCAYTNHTILAEALETWPYAYLQKVVPQLMGIIEALDAVADSRDHAENTAIIDKQHQVHMAYMDMHFGKSVNGVAALHTKILKEEELKQFYALYPDKFNNKTNGITFTRWIQACNPQLTAYLEHLLGKGAVTDAEKLQGLMKYRKQESVIQQLLAIKQEKKQEWAAHMLGKQGKRIDPNAIFDTQVKRMHEYKRQQMNALWLIKKYLEIKNGKLPPRPITAIFGAKAAPAYTIAKDIIHVLLCLEDIIDHDPKVSPYLQVCFIENYNITEAELVIPASDISEQISLASKEASGTGNMKFMLNGALTLGTSDGANVEIADLVGHDNIYLFGESSEQVIQHYQKMDYCSRDYYEEDEDIKEWVDFLCGPQMLAIGDKVNLRRFRDELLNKDWFMTLLDVKDYIKQKEQMLMDYEDRMAWGEKMLVNIANSGFFSSERTIKEYNRDIWNLL